MKLTIFVRFLRGPVVRTRVPVGGYFTTAAALQQQLSYRLLSYYVSTGAVERVTRGVYRLVDYPPHPHGDLIAATLWAGESSAVSHESALALYDLGAAMPTAIHLTVPQAFRGRRLGVRVHSLPLPPTDRRVWEDVPVTTVERTLIDASTSVDPSLLAEAVEDALTRGLTTRRRLTRAATGASDAVALHGTLGIDLSGPA